jgi:hypothetical protein
MRNSEGLALFGVCLGATQSGFGEASYLAMSSFYNPRVALTHWSSGTGAAGLFGYTWVIAFTKAAGLSFQTTLLLANVIAACFSYTYFRVLEPPKVSREEDSRQLYLSISKPDLSTLGTGSFTIDEKKPLGSSAFGTNASDTLIRHSMSTGNQVNRRSTLHWPVPRFIHSLENFTACSISSFAHLFCCFQSLHVTA